MAILNQFQQYSQGENTVTNNVLLMLSNLYRINPKYYEEFIKGLIDDNNEYEIIPIFEQQIGNKGDGIIDGCIQIKASKIIIETKLHGLECVGKLIKYAKSFNEHEQNILLHLSSRRYAESEIKNIKDKLKEIKELEGIKFNSVTYQDLVDQLKELASNYIYEQNLQGLNEDFENYCLGMGLMPNNNRLRVMACGQSYDLNIKHSFYFDLASRGYSDFKFMGIYKWKSVRNIGIVEKVIEADWDEALGLVIKNNQDVTKEQKERLEIAIKESVRDGWGIATGHRFFLLKDLTETNFKKESPGGIFRVRYFNLDEILGKVPEDIKIIAEQLKEKNWK